MKTFEDWRAERLQRLELNADRMRQKMTPEERIIWPSLLALGFEHQVCIGGRRIMDFYNREAGVAVEIDGSQHYSERGLHMKDRRRDDFLRANGVKCVLHFPNRRVREETEAVLEECLKALLNPVMVEKLNRDSLAGIGKARRKTRWPKRKFRGGAKKL
jgi:very-short-patch-repair endonuclease